MADDCTFGLRQSIQNGPEANEQPIGVDEITTGGSTGLTTGEGLRPGEAVDFAISETEIANDRFVNIVTNLS